jgi:hypothetical protein
MIANFFIKQTFFWKSFLRGGFQEKVRIREGARKRLQEGSRVESYGECLLRGMDSQVGGGKRHDKVGGW